MDTQSRGLSRGWSNFNLEGHEVVEGGDEGKGCRRVRKGQELIRQLPVAGKLGARRPTPHHLHMNCLQAVGVRAATVIAPAGTCG